MSCFPATSDFSRVDGLCQPSAGLLGNSLRWVRAVAAAAGLTVLGNWVANGSEAQFRPVPDPRFEQLKRFFHRYNCPEPHYVGDYLRAADGYGLDYRLLPAISIRETHCGLDYNLNNYWGYHPGHAIFPTIEAGIYHVAHQLAEDPQYKGKSLREKLFVYNPRDEYPDEVKRIMRQIK
ncbi:MAG: hypothetical protein JO307_10525 [Bryobacterales bacterium]|nr:hypothetical protein [Bryobacterales bacterium]MBV9397394.1 hypothetical protein [Bryobacterales bacterium]